jgi:glutamate racemase
MFGTETTVGEGAHLAALSARGVHPDRVVTQSCPQLAAYIEQDIDGMETGLLVDAYVSEALSKAGEDDAKIYVSLNCTHYGYALDAWRQAFADHGIDVAGFLDPNTTMANRIAGLEHPKHDRAVAMRVRVVSMIEIPETTIAAIGGWLEKKSSAAARALRHYEIDPGLFPWRDLCAVQGSR